MNKTLVILTPGFPKDETDSTCVPFPQSFVKTLKEQNPGLRIIVLTFQYPFRKGEYDWHGVQVIAFNGQNKGNLHRILLWKAVWDQLRLIQKQCVVIGLLNFWLGECAFLGKLASKRWKLKSFIWILGQDAKKGNRYYRLIRPSPDSLIALSDFISDEMYRNYQIKPLHIISPGIDPAMFSDGDFVRDIDIMGAGSLIPLKQFDQFVWIIASLIKYKPDLTAMICGEGPEREKLERLIRENHLESHIKLTGELQHKDVLTKMQSAKIFLHTSSYEGYGMVCAEALYAGAHVVSYSKPMNKEYHHWNHVKTESEMLNKAVMLLNDSKLNFHAELTTPIQETCSTVLDLYN